MVNRSVRRRQQRQPILDKDTRRILGYYAYTILMGVAALAAFVAACMSLTFTNAAIPSIGDVSMLWRIPMFGILLALSWYLYYRIIRFWDPADARWMEQLVRWPVKLFRRK